MRLYDMLSILTLAVWVYALADWFTAKPFIIRLPRRPLEPLPEQPPLVSVIVAAKEEEASIDATIRQLLGQSYPRLEIIAVNDRSQDATGLKLDELRRQADARKKWSIPLKVIHVTKLPNGWLGKNHALYQGYAHARGQLLLFTDADIVYHPDAIRQAVAYMLRGRLDHLTLAPAFAVRGFWLGAFVRYFIFGFNLLIRPWRANDDRQRKNGIGIGAFNMLSRQAYEAIGTHKAIALRPDDDLQLGHRVKRAGLCQRIASAETLLSVEWYPSLNEAFRGLEKNMFAGFQYRLPVALSVIAGQLLLFVYPFIGVWLWLPGGGWSAAAYGLSALLMLTLYALHTRAFTGRLPFADLPVLPATALLMAYVTIRSVWLAVRRGGIYWRGTFYPLRDLKHHHRRR